MLKNTFYSRAVILNFIILRERSVVVGCIYFTLIFIFSTYLEKHRNLKPLGEACSVCCCFSLLV